MQTKLGFAWGLQPKKILVRRGDHSVSEVGGGSDHQFTTVNTCGSAAGVKLPPFILYKGKHLYSSWTGGGPAGACYRVSPSGWMDETNYYKWFGLQFYPAVKETSPVILFFDGHYSHMSISLIKKARSFGIHLFSLHLKRLSFEIHHFCLHPTCYNHWTWEYLDP